MKIIFSRKGFDAEAGGVASPILLPDARLCSIPIPSPKRGNNLFRDIRFDNEDVGRIVEDLTRNKKKRYVGSDRTHFDPDLRRDALRRDHGWLPTFGQCGAAQTQLERNGVGVGDLFLFFGWFRKVREENGHYQYVRKAPNIHLVFGWLQVGEIYHSFLPDARIPGWARRHPHIYNSYANETWYRMSSYCDTVYVSKKRLELPGFRQSLPGGGVFERYHNTLCLTEAGALKSVWRLPGWMYPFPEKRPLPYHEDRHRWQRDRNGTLLKTVARGQEFVLDCSQYPQWKVRQWLAGLFRAAG